MKISTEKYIDNQNIWAEKVDKERYEGLKLYMESEFASIRRAVDKVEETNRQAVNEVKETNRQKFEAQNEWRQQFKDQTGTFLTRREFWGGLLAIAIALMALYFKK